MNLRRQKLAGIIALQTSGAVVSQDHLVAELRAYPVREPVSGRSYTVLRLRTRSGITGWGECGRITASELDKARRALIGKPATAYATVSTGTPLDGGIDMALL